jgi:hypothetical protein
MDQPTYFIESIGRTAAAIRDHGLMIQVVDTGLCDVPGCTCRPGVRPWAYSIGLVEAELPELLTFGLGVRPSGRLLNLVAAALLDGESLPQGRDADLVLDGVPLRLIPVPERCIDSPPDVMGQWFAYYAATRGGLPTPEVLQVVYADHLGRFPWTPGVSARRKFMQPVLADQPNALRPQLSPMWQTRRRSSPSGKRRR